MKSMTFLACLIAAYFAVAVLAQSSAPMKTNTDVEELIKRLASKDFRTREEAQRRARLTRQKARGRFRDG